MYNLYMTISTLDYAELTDAETGFATQPAEQARWRLPSTVEHDDDYVYFVFGEPTQDTGGDLEVLDAFVALAEAPPKRIAAFARKYGALDLPTRFPPAAGHATLPTYGLR